MWIYDFLIKITLQTCLKGHNEAENVQYEKGGYNCYAIDTILRIKGLFLFFFFLRVVFQSLCLVSQTMRQLSKVRITEI